jgi:hypothetical protein
MIDEGREEVKVVKEFKELQGFRRVHAAETFPRGAA